MPYHSRQLRMPYAAHADTARSTTRQLPAPGKRPETSLQPTPSAPYRLPHLKPHLSTASPPRCIVAPGSLMKILNTSLED